MLPDESVERGGETRGGGDEFGRRSTGVVLVGGRPLRDPESGGAEDFNLGEVSTHPRWEPL